MVVITGQQIVAAGAFLLGWGVTTVAWSFKYGRKLGPLIKFLGEFRGDWLGIADRPGFPGHPGMAERMYRTEERQAHQDERLQHLVAAMAVVQRELLTNGGSSLRDAIVRIEQQLHITSAVVGAPVPAGSIGPDAELYGPTERANPTQKAA